LPGSAALRNLGGMSPRLVGLVAGLALIAGAGVAAYQWMGTRPGSAPPADPPATGPASQPSDAAIEQALRQARGAGPTPAPAAAATDSTEDKNRWVSVVKGFDYDDLSPARRKLFVQLANQRRCTCGCGYTLAGCRSYDPTCPVSGPRVRAMLDSIRALPR